MNNFSVEKFKIGRNYKPFIIAEMSGNHNQSLAKALEITEAAAKAGAHALKLQTYTPDTMTIDIKDGDFLINDKNSLWNGHNLYDLYKIAHTPWEWHEPIINKAKELGMLCFSTPFDETAVDFLEELEVPIYKIASFENGHLPLIKKIASTGKPIILSTGMATMSELSDAVSEIRNSGCDKLILLKCTSSYPASPTNSNILTIPHMRALFGCEVGLSDHTMGIGAALSAIAHGACVIEKHFTLNRADEGVDSEFSLEPDEMKALVHESEVAWQSLGKIKYGPSDAEKDSMIFRRSIYICDDMKRGDTFNEKNIRIIRPGLGLAPKYIDKIIGRKIKNDAMRGTALTWSLVG